MDLDPGYDPNEGMPDVPEPEALETAEALAALCDLLGSGTGFATGFTEPERDGGFCFLPWEPDIAINFKGSEFILSLRHRMGASK